MALVFAWVFGIGLMGAYMIPTGKVSIPGNVNFLVLELNIYPDRVFLEFFSFFSETSDDAIFCFLKLCFINV